MGPILHQKLLLKKRTCIFFKDANEVSQHEFEAMLVWILTLVAYGCGPRAKKVVDNCK